MTWSNHRLHHLHKDLQELTVRVLRSWVQSEVTGIAQSRTMSTVLLDPIQELMGFPIQQASTERYAKQAKSIHSLDCWNTFVMYLSFGGLLQDKRVNWHSTPFNVRLDRALNKTSAWMNCCCLFSLEWIISSFSMTLQYTIVDSAYLFSLVVFMCQFDCITLRLICTVTVHAAGAGKSGFVCVCPGRLFAKHNLSMAIITKYGKIPFIKLASRVNDSKKCGRILFKVWQIFWELNLRRLVWQMVAMWGWEVGTRYTYYKFCDHYKFFLLY